MDCTRKLTQGVYWVGGSDRRLALFENLFPVPRGVSYNSYLILDEKTALMPWTAGRWTTWWWITWSQTTVLPLTSCAGVSRR